MGVISLLEKTIKAERSFMEMLRNKNKGRQFANLASNVDIFIKEFRAIPDDLILDESYMEKFVIEKIGLNNEDLSQQPSELTPYYGKGLYIWQYPKQFAKYIIWLMKNAKSCNSYLEIGCRWGGTFIVTCEVLRRANPNFKYAIAADIIAKTPFIERYSEIIKKDGLEIVYFQGFSTSNDFADLVGKKKPDIAFIDGDHTCIGVLQDHMLVREYSKIIVHHDISSDACSHTTFLWKCLKVLENTRDSIEFTDQYQSVNGRFLGIGVLLANINK